MAEITKELGRIPVSRGDYQATTEYYKDNIVQYKRSSYQVVSESPIIGVPPTNDKNIVNLGWTLFAGTLDAQDVVNQVKDQEIKSIQAVADREAEILAKSDAAEVSFDNTGTSISGTNVQDALEKTDSKLSKLESEVIYDVTTNNDGAIFSSLSALLSSENLSTLIPTSVRHGGISIRFVHSSDNKYVQYRYIGIETTGSPNPFLDIANWQGVDIEPTIGSHNLVESGGITDVYGKYVDSENVPLLKYKDKDKKELFRFGTNGKPIFPKNDTFDVVDTTNSSNIYNIKDKKGTYIEKLHNNGTREHKNNLDTFNKVSVKELHIRSSKGLSKLGNQLNMLTDIFTFNPYYECLQYVLQLKRPHSEYPQLDQEGLLLCWFSDLHGADDNFSRIIQFKNAFPKYIDDTILTGDIVMAQYPDNISFIEKYNANDTLLVIGNHDVWRRNQTPVENMPELDVYNKFFKPYIANWNVTQPSNADTGKCYYYKDYNSKKIRLIVVNCMHDTEAQRNWFTATLADAKTKGLHVICSSHYPVDSAVITADNNKALTDNTFQAYDERYNLFKTSSMSRFCATEVDNFINNGGNFVCWICGHMHSDYFGLCANHHTQLMIGVENAGHHKDGNDSDRVTGTKTQDSFNLISFDVSKKFIRIVRIGNDFDRLLRHKKAITYNYVENKIIINY